MCGMRGGTTHGVLPRIAYIVMHGDTTHGVLPRIAYIVMRGDTTHGVLPRIAYIVMRGDTTHGVSPRVAYIVMRGDTTHGVLPRIAYIVMRGDTRWTGLIFTSFDKLCISNLPRFMNRHIRLSFGFATFLRSTPLAPILGFLLQRAPERCPSWRLL